MKLLVQAILFLYLDISAAVCFREDPRLIVLSFDGFWYKYVNMYNTTNLKSLMQSGVTTQRMDPMYITKTWPNHFSIATGVTEEVHGIVSNDMYDPLYKERFKWSSKDERMWNYNRKVLPIWVANQKFGKQRYSGGIMWPGVDVKIQNQTAFYYQSYQENPDLQGIINTIIKWMTDPQHPANCIFAYIEKPDVAGHEFGPFSSETRKEVLEADAITGYLVRKLKEAGLFHTTNLIILSDHGMAEIVSTNAIAIDDIIDPRDYILSGSSPVWNIQPKRGKTKILYQKLKKASRTKPFKVYMAENIPRVYRYSKNRRILPILIEAKLGWDLVHKINRTAARKTTGNHGYDNRLDSMTPLFLGHGPDFKVQYVSKPFRNIDLYPLMCLLLRLPVKPSEGKLKAIKHLLKPRRYKEILRITNTRRRMNIKEETTL